MAGGRRAGAKLALPIETKAAATAVVPVPVPTAVSAAAPGPARPDKPVGKATTSNDLDRKRAALKAVEDAAEKLKEEAARNPKNAALAKAYLQLCEAALALKAEVIETEATLANREGNK